MKFPNLLKLAELADSPSAMGEAITLFRRIDNGFYDHPRFFFTGFHITDEGRTVLNYYYFEDGEKQECEKIVYKFHLEELAANNS